MVVQIGLIPWVVLEVRKRKKREEEGKWETG